MCKPMGESFIKLENLHKSFEKGEGRLEVLKGLDLELEKGEMLAVLGASGAGKSTILHILGGLERPTEGRVLYEGKDIYAMSDGVLSDFRNSEIGFVFQFHHLLPEFTALENVMMPALIARMKNEEAKERANELLDKMGLRERTSHKPGELSGGEQQRVAIARALIISRGALLADEPTGNLDSKTGEAVFSTMTQVTEDLGITVVMVTHNEQLASKFARQIVVQDGRITA